MEQVLFNIKLDSKENNSLSSIINFLDPANTTLTSSVVYNVINTSNSFLGFFFLPKDSINDLNVYLNHCKSKNEIIDFEISTVKDERRNASFSRYESDIGWKNLTPSKWKQISRQFNTSKLRRKPFKSNSKFLSSSFNMKWDFLQYKNPEDIISFFCDTKISYDFLSLPLGSTRKGRKFLITNSEIALLKYLIDKNVLKIIFQPNRLILDYSLYFYYIEIQLLHLDQLSSFLSLLPYSQLFFTNNNIVIFTYLPEKLAHLLSTEINWNVVPISISHYPQKFDSLWFDKEKLSWKKPTILVSH